MTHLFKHIAASPVRRRSRTERPSPPSTPVCSPLASPTRPSKPHQHHSPTHRTPSSPLRQATSAATLFGSPDRVAVQAAIEHLSLDPSLSPLIGNLTQQLKESPDSVEWLALAGLSPKPDHSGYQVTDKAQFNCFFSELKALKTASLFYFTDSILIPLLRTLISQENSLVDPTVYGNTRGQFHFLPEHFIRQFNGLAPISIGYRYPKTKEEEDDSSCTQERTTIEVFKETHRDSWGLSHENSKGEKVGKIGEGGWGYLRFVDTYGNRKEPYVTKKIPISMALFYETLYYVVREMIAAETLKGVPNTVGFTQCVLSYGSNGEPKLYGFMPFVDGKNLLNSPLTPAERKEGFKSLARTVASAHEKGVIFCDLKPENVLKNRKTGQFFAIDFGMASLETDYESRSLTKGTSPYWAPELNPSRPECVRFTKASDTYAFALLYLETCTRIQLFTSPRVINPVEDHAHAMKYIFWAENQGYICEKEAALLANMLSVEPSLRPTMLQVSEALTSIS